MYRDRNSETLFSLSYGRNNGSTYKYHILSLQNIVLNSCKEKTEWVDNTSDATTQDFISQKAALDEIVEPILLKLTEPGEHNKTLFKLYYDFLSLYLKY